MTTRFVRPGRRRPGHQEMFARDLGSPGIGPPGPHPRLAGRRPDQDSEMSSKRLIATTSSWRIKVLARFLLIPKRTES